MRILLRNIAVITRKTYTARCLDIQIDEREITAISDQRIPVDGFDVVVDGVGKLAIPGLVNSHTHLPMVLFRGLADDLPLSMWLEDHVWPLEEQLTEQEVYWSTLLAVVEMIRSGTTQCSDMYFHVDAIGRAIEEAGIRASLSYGIIATKLDGHGKREIEKAKDTVSQWHNEANGRISVAVAPHGPVTCGKDVWEEAISLAVDKELMLHTHLAETKWEVEKCLQENGLHPVDYLEQIGAFSVPMLAAHCVHVEEKQIDVLATRSVFVVHCPKSNAKLGSGIAPIASMKKAGVQVLIGTDGAASNNSLDMIEEARTAALIQKASLQDPTVLSAQEVFHMCAGDRTQFLQEEQGGLEVGQRADIVLVDMDRPHLLPAFEDMSTLMYAGHRTDVTDVIVDGQFLLRDSELVTIDEQEVVENVKQIAGKYRN